MRTSSILQWILPLLALCSVPVYAGARHERCGLAAISDDSVADVPKLEPGTVWVYSVGAGQPETEMTLMTIDGARATYGMRVIAPKTEFSAEYRPAEEVASLHSGPVVISHSERVETYTDINPLREGAKILLQFPFHVGSSWEDEFSEPGEQSGAFGRYQYRYEERSFSEVVAVEEIETAFGKLSAFRIERFANWVKSQPVSETMSYMRVDDDGTVTGRDASVSWYVPALGRVVMRVEAVSQSGHLPFDRNLRIGAANTRVVELISYSTPSGCAFSGQPIRARLPSAPPSGYRFRDNNTWEYMLQTRGHRAMRDPR